MILPIKNFKVRSKIGVAEADYVIGKQRYRFQLRLTGAEIPPLTSLF